MKDYIEERRQEEKQRRIRQILKAARRVFVRKGFRNATMEEIARAARLSKAALYLYFPSKEDLYLEIVYAVFQHFFEFSLKGLSEDLSPDQTLYQFGQRLFQYAQQHWDQYILAAHFNFTEVAAKAEAHRTERLNRLLQEYLEKGMAVVEQGKQAGIFREDLDPCLVMLSLWVSINGAILQWHFGRPTFLSPDLQLQTFIDFVLNTFLRGICLQWEEAR